MGIWTRIRDLTQRGKLRTEDALAKKVEKARDLARKRDKYPVIRAGTPGGFGHEVEMLREEKERAEILAPKKVSEIDRRIRERDKWRLDLERLREIDVEIRDKRRYMNDVKLDFAARRIAHADAKQALEGVQENIDALEKERETIKKESPGYAMYRKKMHYARAPLFGKIEGGETPKMRILEPKIRSAINRGRIELQKEAKEIFNEKLKDITDKIEKAEEEVKKAGKNLEEALDAVDKLLKKAVGEGGGLESFGGKASTIAAMLPDPRAKAIGAILGATEGAKTLDAAASLAVARLNYTKDQLLEKEKIFENLKNTESDPRVAVDMMKNPLEEKAKDIAKKIIHEFDLSDKMGVKPW